MKLPVTEAGVTLPKVWFGDATEVEVRRENGHVLVDAVMAKVGSQPARPSDAEDPIWNWGDDAVDLGITDASVNLDKYLMEDMRDFGQ